MNRRIRTILQLLFTAMILVYPPVSYSCTIIAVGKKASTDGSVIVSHTDCGPDNRIRVVHGQNFRNGEMAPVYWGIQ